MKSSAGGGRVSLKEIAEGVLVKGDSANLASSFFSLLPGYQVRRACSMGVLVWSLIFIVG